MNTYIAIIRTGSTLDRQICDVPEKWNRDPARWFHTFRLPELPKGSTLVALVPKDECEQVAALLEDIP